MSMQTPLSRVRGLGSAKNGTHHFWVQRVTAVALIPLTIWFVALLAANTGADYETAVTLLGSPHVAILMLLFIVTGLYHLKLGLQVVIEDYVSAEGSKIILLMLNNFFAVAVGFASVFAILKLSFGG